MHTLPYFPELEIYFLEANHSKDRMRESSVKFHSLLVAILPTREHVYTEAYTNSLIGRSIILDKKLPSNSLMLIIFSWWLQVLAVV